MAISTPILALAEPIERDDNRWALNFPSADFDSGGLNEELKAAPGAAKALYLTHVTMGTVDSAVSGYTMDAKISLVDGAGITFYGPIQFQAQGQSTTTKDFDPPLKLTDNKALDCVAASGGDAAYQGAVIVYVEGFTGDKPLG